MTKLDSDRRLFKKIEEASKKILFMREKFEKKEREVRGDLEKAHRIWRGTIQALERKRNLKSWEG